MLSREPHSMLAGSPDQRGLGGLDIWLPPLQPQCPSRFPHAACCVSLGPSDHVGPPSPGG